jgi:uncharacterized damage-inducible protein DinB
MSEIQTTIDELKNIHEGDPWHGPALKEILTGVTAAQACARPLPGAHSIWELILHLAAWENVVSNRLSGRAMNEPDEGHFPQLTETSESAWQKALTELDETHRKLIDKIAAVTDEGAIVAGKDYSTAYMLRGIVHHHVYHAGQIILLKKAL